MTWLRLRGILGRVLFGPLLFFFFDGFRRRRIAFEGVFDVAIGGLPNFVWVGLEELDTGKHAPREAAVFAANELDGEHALMVGVSLHGIVNEAPVITEVWSVDTPVGAACHIDVLLAVCPVANYQVRTLFRIHFSKALGRQFTGDRAMDAIVKLLWIQLQSDKLLHATNKRKSFELRKIEIGIEVRGNFRGSARSEQKQGEHNRDKQAKALAVAPRWGPDRFHKIPFGAARMKTGSIYLRNKATLLDRCLIVVNVLVRAFGQLDFLARDLLIRNRAE